MMVKTYETYVSKRSKDCLCVKIPKDVAQYNDKVKVTIEILGHLKFESVKEKD